MRKIKVLFIIVAVAAGIGGALATQQSRSCEEQTQYFKWGSWYFEAGEYGTDYHCAGSVGVCTYYRPYPGQPNTYIPCRTGNFTFGPGYNSRGK